MKKNNSLATNIPFAQRMMRRYREQKKVLEKPARTHVSQCKCTVEEFYTCPNQCPFGA